MDRLLMRCAPHSALISIAGRAPDLLRVFLEELQVQLPAEAVDEEILEAALGPAREQHRPGSSSAPNCAQRHRPELERRFRGSPSGGSRRTCRRSRCAKAACAPASRARRSRSAVAAGAQRSLLALVGEHQVPVAGSWVAPAASGSMRVHQSITQSDLEKKRWPPMSMRLPLYSTDCDRPPTLRVASSTTMSRTPASASSQAAVRPAGPAPMITIFLSTVRSLTALERGPSCESRS